MIVVTTVGFVAQTVCSLATLIGTVLETQSAIRRHHTYVFVMIGIASDDVYKEDRLFTLFTKSVYQDIYDCI